MKECIYIAKCVAYDGVTNEVGMVSASLFCKQRKSVTQMTSFTRRVIFDYSRLKPLSNFQPQASSTYCSIVGTSAREGILDLKVPP